MSLSALLRTRRGEDQGTLDPRLAGLGDDRLRDLFRNKRVLDIGCNEGKVSLDIGTMQSTQSWYDRLIL